MSKKLSERFEEALKYLTALTRYYDDTLPEIETLADLSDRKRRQICRAFEIMEARDPESLSTEQLSAIMHGLSALPTEWPANSGAFVHHLHQVVRGQRPTRMTLHPDGSVAIEEYAGKSVH